MSNRTIHLVGFALALGFCLMAGVAGASTIKINFQSAGAPIPEGYLPEYGDVFGPHESGWNYGWDRNIRAGARDRNSANAPDQRYDTLNHVQQDGVSKTWEIELPNGTYNVFLVCGDPSYADQANNFDIEGVQVVDADPLGTAAFDFDEYRVTVQLSDGRLTIKPGPGANNSKVCFVDMESDALTKFFQKARKPDPADGAEGVKDPLLMWTPGDTTVKQQVYFGTDPAALVQVVEQDFAIYWHPDPLVPGTRYYWRIDGVLADGTVIPGDVWSFVSLSMAAWGPKPSDGATNVLIDTKLSWKKGESTLPLKHHLFFGTDKDAVAAGTGGTDKGVLQQVTYDPGILQADTAYYFRVNEVELTGSERQGNVWSFRTVEPGPGRIIREWWFDINGSNVSNLTSNARYPNSPDGWEFVSFFQGPTNWAEQFGSRLRGWLFPPETGAYTFQIDAENEGQIRLSPDEDPAKAVVIANTAAQAQSQPQNLVAGKRYYIEALMKGSTMGDSISVSWQGPGIGSMTVISGKYVGATPYLAKKAYAPFPADGASGVKQTSILSWSPGTYAVSHQLYFGTDANAVKNASTASPEYKGTKALGVETYDPGKLAWNTAYYWRVDEVNSANAESPWIGNLWSFSTGPFLVVDDFEAFNDIDPPNPASDRLFDAWIDGFGTLTNGAVVGHTLPPYAEQSTVHSGRQSMPYAYDNVLKTSEATLTLVYPRDWTEEGVGKLSLWFIGAAANSAEKMYVVLNGTAVVYHSNPAVTQTAAWTEWVIDLQAFQGVALTNVNTLTIGFGTRGSPAAGGAGTMYFDDIRLYRP